MPISSEYHERTFRLPVRILLMEMRRIARIGLDIPRIGLGCVTFGREIDEAQSFRVLDYAFERGITLLDTAEAYGGGQAREYRKGLGLIDNNPISG